MWVVHHEAYNCSPFLIMTISVYNVFKRKNINVFCNVGRLGGSFCTKCDAKLFDGERNICCLDGKVKLRPLHPPTDIFKSYFDGNTRLSKDQKSRYNTICDI